MDEKLYLPDGSGGDGAFSLVVTPERAGWAHSGLRVLALQAGAAHTWATGDDELLVLPLSGSCTVTCDGENFDCMGGATCSRGSATSPTHRATRR